MSARSVCSYLNPFSWGGSQAAPAKESLAVTEPTSLKMDAKPKQKPEEVFFRILQGMQLNGRAQKRLIKFSKREHPEAYLNSVYKALSHKKRDEYVVKQLEYLLDSDQRHLIADILPQVCSERLALSLQVISDEQGVPKDEIEGAIFYWIISLENKQGEEEIEFFRKILKFYTFTRDGVRLIIGNDKCRGIFSRLLLEGKIEDFQDGEMTQSLSKEKVGSLYVQVISVLKKKEGFDLPTPDSLSEPLSFEKEYKAKPRPDQRTIQIRP